MFVPITAKDWVAFVKTALLAPQVAPQSRHSAWPMPVAIFCLGAVLGLLAGCGDPIVAPCTYWTQDGNVDGSVSYIVVHYDDADRLCFSGLNEPLDYKACNVCDPATATCFGQFFVDAPEGQCWEQRQTITPLPGHNFTVDIEFRHCDDPWGEHHNRMLYSLETC